MVLVAIYHEAVNVALVRAVEEAVLVVVVTLVRPMVAVVTTPLIVLTSLVAVSEARHRHEVVDCCTGAPPLLLMRQWVGLHIEDDRHQK